MSEVNPEPTDNAGTLYPQPDLLDTAQVEPSAPEPSPEPVQADPDAAAPDAEKEPDAHVAAPDGAEPAKSEEDEGEPVATFAELMEAKELDSEWVETLTIPVKVNGEDGEVAIKDLVASYRMNQAAEERLEKVKVQAKTANEEIAKQTESLNTQLAAAARLMSRAEAAIAADEDSIDENLKEDDPAEYLLKKAEIKERRDGIEAAKREVTEEITLEAQQRAELMQEQHQQYVELESAQLLEKIPEWKDEEKAKAEKPKIAEYLIAQGFPQEEVMAVADHRLILVARKAMLHDAMSNNAPLKKVVKTPKVMKPGVKAETNKTQPTDRASILYG